jgi:hypothetical protein
MKVPSLFKTVEGWMLAIVVASLLAFSGSLWLKINYGYNTILMSWLIEATKKNEVVEFRSPTTLTMPELVTKLPMPKPVAITKKSTITAETVNGNNSVTLEVDPKPDTTKDEIAAAITATSIANDTPVVDTSNVKNVCTEVRLKKKNRLYSVRYVDKQSSNGKILIWSHEGKRKLNKRRLSRTVYAVLDRVTFVPTSTKIHDMVMETIATESNMGYYVVQVGGPALSLCQIEPGTAKELEAWVKAYHKDVYKEIKQFWEYSKSDTYNYTNNVPYNIALCLAVYWWRTGYNFLDLCNTRESRAATYKLTYNSVLGKNSTERYIADAERYLDDK